MTTVIIVCTIAIITVAALNWAKARKEAYEAKLMEAAQKVLGDKYDDNADSDICKIYRFIGEEYLQVQKDTPSELYHRKNITCAIMAIQEPGVIRRELLNMLDRRELAR